MGVLTHITSQLVILNAHGHWSLQYWIHKAISIKDVAESCLCKVNTRQVHVKDMTIHKQMSQSLLIKGSRRQMIIRYRQICRTLLH